MFNTTDRAYDLVEKTGASMYAFCKSNRIAYSTIADHHQRGTRIGLETVDQICTALEITMSEFFKDDPKGE